MFVAAVLRQEPNHNPHVCNGQPHVEPIKGKKSTACARLEEAARGGVEYSN